MDTHTAAVAVVEARSVTAVQSLLTTHVGAQLVRVCVCVWLGLSGCVWAERGGSVLAGDSRGGVGRTARRGGGTVGESTGHAGGRCGIGR